MESNPLTIVGWLWRDKRTQARYTAANANTWARMIHRHLKLPHKFLLLTDQPEAEFDDLITPVPLWDDWRNLRNAQSTPGSPQCYVRLKAFSDEARAVLGERFVSIDLDCIVTGNLDPLFTRDEDFLIWRRPKTRDMDRQLIYQGSMWMMSAGARRQVWDDFKGEESVKAATANPYLVGTDQVWMRHVLGENESGWTDADGVYGWHWLEKDTRYFKAPPENARIIFFNTRRKPWDIIGDDGKLRCHNCREVVEVYPPYALMYEGTPNKHPWLARYYQ